LQQRQQVTMAEYAQKAIEEMLPDQRRTKEKEVYLQYIQYEIGVQQLVKLRREVTERLRN